MATLEMLNNNKKYVKKINEKYDLWNLNTEEIGAMKFWRFSMLSLILGSIIQKAKVPRSQDFSNAEL